MSVGLRISLVNFISRELQKSQADRSLIGISKSSILETDAGVTVLSGVGSLGRPIMGVRGEALQRVNRPFPGRDNGQQPARSRFNLPSRPGQRLRECGAGTMDWDQAAAVSLVHQNSVPSVQMHRRITVILRVMATRAFFDPMRRASRVPHGLRGDQRCTFVRRTLAAS